MCRSRRSVMPSSPQSQHTAQTPHPPHAQATLHSADPDILSVSSCPAAYRTEEEEEAIYFTADKQWYGHWGRQRDGFDQSQFHEFSYVPSLSRLGHTRRICKGSFRLDLEDCDKTVNSPVPSVVCKMQGIQGLKCRFNVPLETRLLQQAGGYSWHGLQGHSRHKSC